jgi:hypothetical protein
MKSRLFFSCCGMIHEMVSIPLLLSFVKSSHLALPHPRHVLSPPAGSKNIAACSTDWMRARWRRMCVQRKRRGRAVCMHVFVCIIHVCMHVCVCIIHVCMHVCVCNPCVYACVCVYNPCVYACVCVYNPCVYACVCVYNPCVYTCVCVYNPCVYACVCVYNPCVCVCVCVYNLCVYGRLEQI